MATAFNTFQQIKRRFFALRNGAVGESMRRQGAPYRIIFGLNLPQIVEISREFGPDAEIAERLWANVSTRESLLLAPMIYPRDEMTREKSVEWLRGAPTTETVDVLCHRLLRYRPFAVELASDLAVENDDMLRYASLRLLFNLLPQSADVAVKVARAECGRGCVLTRSVAAMLLDEAEYILEN